MPPRILLPSNADTLQANAKLTLRGDQFHHLKNVLRLRIGDEIEVCSPNKDAYFLSTIEAIQEGSLVLRLGRRIVPPSVPKLTLISGVVRDKHCDFITAKAVELGVTSVHFFFGERSQHRGQHDRLGRLMRVAEAALKQSGVHAMPEIQLHADLSSALCAQHDANPPGEAEWRIVLSPDPDAPRLIRFGGFAAAQTRENTGDFSEVERQQLRVEDGAGNAESYLIVGPEGGLTAEEQKLALSYCYQPASLGDKILRTETATLVASAVVLLLRS